MESYPKFKYDSPSTTPKDSFNTSNFNQYEASPSGEAQEIQSSPLVELKGGDIAQDALGEQTIAQSEQQVSIKVLVKQKAQQVFAQTNQ